MGSKIGAERNVELYAMATKTKLIPWGALKLEWLSKEIPY